MENILDGILPSNESSDMKLVGRVPLIINNRWVDVAQTLINQFKFWYHDNMFETSQVFWSENHYIMYTSSELVLREFLGMEIPDYLHQRIKCFLKLKSSLGFSEWLSPVYLPFTIAGLLNIYDHSKVEAYRTLANKCLNRLALQLLTASLLDGSVVSPSGRSYARHRQTTRNGHIANFINYLVNREKPTYNPSDPEQALKTVMASTTWKPSDKVYENFEVGPLDIDLTISPRWTDLIMFLDSYNPSSDIYVSLLWNYGAYFPLHLRSLSMILKHMDDVKLWKHPHFKALSGSRTFLKFIFSTDITAYILFYICSLYVVKSYALAGLLTDAQLRVHREGKVLMSSLMNYNPGLPCFQQWPWAINLNGIPIWCAFGKTAAVGLSALGNKQAASEISTSRLTPYVYQEGDRLLAKYAFKDTLLSLIFHDLKPIMRWPVEEFDEYGEREISGSSWHWARKGTAAMAYRIQKLIVNVVVRDLEVSETNTIDLFLSSIKDFNI